MGRSCVDEKLSLKGLSVMAAPNVPIMIAVMRHGPTFSPSMGTASNDTNNGYVYKPEAIWATDNTGAAEKKQNIQMLSIIPRM